MVSMFGLYVGLLQQRDILPAGILKSPAFMSVVGLVNSVDLQPQEVDLDSVVKTIFHNSAQLMSELSKKKSLWSLS